MTCTTTPQNELEVLMKTLQPHLRNLQKFALRLTRDPQDSEDLVQDVMLKLFEHPERLQGVTQPQPWLKKVAYHRYIDQCRQRRLETRNVSLDELVDNGQADPLLDGSDGLFGASPASTDPLELLSEAERGLEAAMVGLSAPQRWMLRLHDLEGYSVLDISRRYGLPENTVKSRLRRGRKALRTMMVARIEAPEDAALAA
jgi:RNA polymerase sigma-70 factor (ECF subfamily)